MARILAITTAITTARTKAKVAAVVVVVVAALLGFTATVSAADCVGPRISYKPVTVDRGSTVEVSGELWGDECYDTGSPPLGEGFLGKPRTDIELYLVQGERAMLVAKGDADMNYEFAVEVPVPTALDPGPATIEVILFAEQRHPAMSEGRPVQITITETEISSEILMPVVFGPGTKAEPTATTTTMADPDQTGSDTPAQQLPGSTSGATGAYRWAMAFAGVLLAWLAVMGGFLILSGRRRASSR